MAQALGKDQAKVVGDNHEICAANDRDEDQSMDLFNNQIGRDLMSEGDCADSCMMALVSDMLQIEPGGDMRPGFCPY